METFIDTHTQTSNGIKTVGQEREREKEKENSGQYCSTDKKIVHT